ncbi:hypothetical protein A6E01_11160 [Vibrio breoganii]|uniref:Uncharacterized protein n=1 Tax=Vibrio breoganii TaxID=553239 RepID=A0AAN0XWB3_9VIBR|nr:hypothetical protein A6E01_11160 [Vibrio breoganii]
MAPLARLNTPSFGCDIFIVHKANFPNQQIQRSPSPRTEAYNVAPLARLNTPSFGCDIFIVHKANDLPKPTDTKKPQSGD